MDGIHDMGGRQGFGRVRYTLDAKAFHAPWEIRVNALYGFAVRSGLFNMDEYRHAIERMEPRHYLAAGYYERTLTALMTLCVEKGVVTPAATPRPVSASSPAILCGCVMIMSAVMCGCPAMSGARPAWLSLNRPPIPFPTPMPMVWRPRMSPPMTCVSTARTCGRIRPIRRWSMSASSKAILSLPERVRINSGCW